jgi:transcriptional regulator with XRE-family HTH domain
VPISLQTHLLNELAAGPDGGPIAESRLVYLQERLRGRFFDFLLSRFDAAREKGLTQAKLARRIRKTPDVINRWLSAPANLTLDSISDLLAGIAAEEPEFTATSLLGRSPVNYSKFDEESASTDETENDEVEPASAMSDANSISSSPRSRRRDTKRKNAQDDAYLGLDKKRAQTDENHILR